MTAPDTTGIAARPRVAIGHRVRDVAPSAVVILAALAIGAVAIAALEAVGLEDASPLYLLAVVAIAVLRGTGPAIVTAVGAFLAYDFLFVEPRFTFTVHDAAEWLNLLLLLVVGVVVGRLAGRERDRAVEAIAREREASAMSSISFTLASGRDLSATLGTIAEIVKGEAKARRAWITVGDAILADTAASPSANAQSPAVHVILRRRPGDEPPEWVRVHAPTRGGKAAGVSAESVHRVAISAGDRVFGSVWFARARDLGEPDAGATRVLAAAADQIGGALERERLQREATTAEISRRSDALKSALLDSVSHDLRTPLASIRAAAGTLMDPDVDWPDEQRRDIAASIDREAEWLNRLVTNLLDMSRVDAGELRPSLAAIPLADLVTEATARAAPALTGRVITIDVPDSLPPVLADEVLMGQVLANTIDNAAKYGGPDAPIRIAAAVGPDGRVVVTIEDGGLGVPDDALPRLFEKFYRVPRKGEGSRRGTGIGLAVVRGLVESMGGTVTARRSELGGLAVVFDLPVAGREGEGSVPG